MKLRRSTTFSLAIPAACPGRWKPIIDVVTALITIAANLRCRSRGIGDAEELLQQRIHVILHGLLGSGADLRSNCADHCAKVEAGVLKVEMAEDARLGCGEEQAALLLQNGVHFGGGTRERLRKLGAEPRKAFLRGRQRLLIPSPIDGAQRVMILELEGGEGVTFRGHLFLGSAKGLLPGLQLSCRLGDVPSLGCLGVSHLFLQCV